MKRSVFLKFAKLVVCVIFLILTKQAHAQYNVTVAKDGSGNYTTVQAAVDAAPSVNATPYKIYIKNGVYKEVILVAKPNIQFIGESVGNTILTFDNNATTPSGGGVLGTTESASTFIRGDDFLAINITFENTTGEAPQALAISVRGLRGVFLNCRFLGGQDTLFANATNGNVHTGSYYKNCYIEGTVDFIFGDATAVFESCVIYGKDRAAAGASYITAPNTKTAKNGYLFRNTVIPDNRGATTYYLGRPWQNDGTTTGVVLNKSIFLNSKFNTAIQAAGWSTWNASTDVTKIFFAEYGSTNFAGVATDVSARASFSKQLTMAEATAYDDIAAYYGDWNPLAIAEVATPFAANIAVSNFKSTITGTTNKFTWNLDWPIASVDMQLQLSVDGGTYNTIQTVTSADAINVNFEYSTTLPAVGTNYKYRIVGVKAGLTTFTSQSLEVTTTPTITITGALGSFLQGVGLPSAVQSYKVSAVNAIADLIIVAPTNFEISKDGNTWVNSTGSLAISPVSNNIPLTTIYVRLNGASAGAASGNITHNTSLGVEQLLAATGTIQSDPLKTSENLIKWPLTANGADEAVSRSVGVNSGNYSYSGFVASNGIAVAAVGPFTSTYGMAFAATADGSFTAANGGPGNTMSKNHYVQFQVKSETGYSLRVDSVDFITFFYNTTGAFALEYSLDGFATAGKIITGGKLADGTSTTGGQFTAPLALANHNTPNTMFRMALNGATGVNVNDGQILTIRIYFRCASSSAGRYALIRNLVFKGDKGIYSPLPLTLLAFDAKLNGTTAKKQVNVSWTTTNEVNTSKFEVLRRSDQSNFSIINTQASKNSPGIHNYSFIDQTPLTGNSYYQLKQIDADGKSTLSEIKPISYQGFEQAVFAYPNPTEGLVNVQHALLEKDGELYVYDLQGQKRLTVPMLAGQNNTSVDLSKLPAGFYILNFEYKGKKEAIKLLKR